METHEREQFKAEVVGIYDRAAHLFDQVGGHEFSYFGRQLVEWLDIPRGATVLDVASGRGAILFPAAEKVGNEGRLIGIDLAPSMVNTTAAEIARRGLTNADMRLMDGDDLDFPDESFDFIICGFALHFLDFKHALPKFLRLLKPGGTFAAIQPTQASVEENQRWSWLFELTRTCFPADFVPPAAWTSPNQLHKRELFEPVLRESGFTDIRFMDDTVTLYWVDEDDWWQWEWSQGSRFWLEGMTPEMLERFKTESFKYLREMKEPDGVGRIFTSLYAAGKNT
jgi:ubiquinone/menaquinone biosynthesis C-methylase UbiE